MNNYNDKKEEKGGFWSALSGLFRGGSSAMGGAISHGIARALVVMDEKSKTALRKLGLLTRDPREKERKKPGLKRARKATQYTKR